MHLAQQITLFFHSPCMFYLLCVEDFTWFLSVKVKFRFFSCPGFILISSCQCFIFSVYRFYFLCVQVLSSLCTGFIFSVYRFYFPCVQVLPYLYRVYLLHVWFPPCNCKGFIFYMYIFFPIHVQVLSSQCIGFICIAPCFDVRRTWRIGEERILVLTIDPGTVGNKGNLPLLGYIFLKF